MAGDDSPFAALEQLGQLLGELPSVRGISLIANAHEKADPAPGALCAEIEAIARAHAVKIPQNVNKAPKDEFPQAQPVSPPTKHLWSPESKPFVPRYFVPEQSEARRNASSTPKTPSQQHDENKAPQSYTLQNQQKSSPANQLWTPQPKPFTPGSYKNKQNGAVSGASSAPVSLHLWTDKAITGSQQIIPGARTPGSLESRPSSTVAAPVSETLSPSPVQTSASFERELIRAREEAYQRGWDAGKKVGLIQGEEKGRQLGRREGLMAGRKRGREEAKAEAMMRAKMPITKQEAADDTTQDWSDKLYQDVAVKQTVPKFKFGNMEDPFKTAFEFALKKI
ncbi:hypothetical protein BDV95DRAFT_607832 [Massariosphaeria phaeospora]|uniref:Uncharacterized protein n=1 Tax=Massariosphaeria phaeospora TaxID=100035 RepID=A0A7C8I4J8_9PLEO|nr:hypothetical protein BDV95DRAFT_607832 [Massariosphaeria phaeospora]